MAHLTAYSPVRSDDQNINGAENFNTNSASNSQTKDKKLCWFGFAPCVLLFLAVVTMFLIGLLVGFYVKELENEDPSVTELCKEHQKDSQDYDVTKFVTYHDTLIYSIHGENFSKFVEKYGTKDPVTGSDLEARLSDEILQEFTKYSFTKVDVEEYDIVVPSADPSRPNRLEILHHNGSRQLDAYLTNRRDKIAKSSLKRNVTPTEWQNAFVAFSPPGEVQGSLVYGHYGLETDFQVLEAYNVSVQDKIVLLRLGKIPVASKVFNVESNGGKAVLLYWEPKDAEASHVELYNTTYIPFASATQFSTDLPTFWKPSIPCQTISVSHARTLMTHLSADPRNVKAPEDWQESFARTNTLGGSTGSFIVRLTVNNQPVKKVIKNIISTIPGQTEYDRYIIVGAPRTALPGQPQDAIASSSLLIQLARAFHNMHQRHKWKPAKGVKLISWGGTELSNLGVQRYIMSHRYLLEQRAIAYIDLSQITLGNDTLEMQSPKGFYETIEKIIKNAVDPKTGEYTFSYMDNDDTTEPYNGDNSESASSLFVHALNLHTIKVQYKMNAGAVNSQSLMLELDMNHHFKYHLAVAHILIKTMLTLLDTPLLQRDVCRDTKNIQLMVHLTSNILDDCSGGNVTL
ncbi:transferrin receptor protein 1, partial [Biomphalaria glabrata]